MEYEDLNNDELLYTVPEVTTLLKTYKPTVRELVKRYTSIALKPGRPKATRAELLRFLNKYTGKHL